jgi:hypothetical protein
MTEIASTEHRTRCGNGKLNADQVYASSLMHQ